MGLSLNQGQAITRRHLLARLVELQYERKDSEFSRGTFRVRGDIIETANSHGELSG